MSHPEEMHQCSWTMLQSKVSRIILSSLPLTVLTTTPSPSRPRCACICVYWLKNQTFSNLFEVHVWVCELPLAWRVSYGKQIRGTTRKRGIKPISHIFCLAIYQQDHLKLLLSFNCVARGTAVTYMPTHIFSFLETDTFLILPHVPCIHDHPLASFFPSAGTFLHTSFALWSALNVAQESFAV